MRYEVQQSNLHHVFSAIVALVIVVASPTPPAQACLAHVDNPPTAQSVDKAATTTTAPYSDSMKLPPPRGSSTINTSSSESKTGGSSSMSALGSSGTLRTIGALAFVLVLIYGVRALTKRFGPSIGAARGPGGVVEVLGRYPLARHQLLVLLRVGPKIILIAQGQQQSSTLAEFSDPQEIATIHALIREAAGDSFNEQFEKLTHKFGLHRNRDAYAGSTNDDRFDSFESDESQQGSNVVVDLTRSRSGSGLLSTTGGARA